MDQEQVPQQRQYVSQPQQSSGMAIASMVLGICSIVTCMAYGIVGLVCGILALHFAKKGEAAIAAGTAPETSRGMLSAGRTCGWIGLSLSILMLLFAVIYIIFIVGIVAAGAAGAAGAGNGPTLVPFVSQLF
ncbi:MAG: hypothetical protein ACF8LL_05460 [Phycisphaerales bacterium]